MPSNPWRQRQSEVPLRRDAERAAREPLGQRLWEACCWAVVVGGRRWMEPLTLVMLLPEPGGLALARFCLGGSLRGFLAY